MEEIERRAHEKNLTDPIAAQALQLIKQGWILNDAEVRTMAQRFPSVTDDRPYSEFPLSNFLRRDEFMQSPEFILKAQTEPGALPALDLPPQTAQRSTGDR